MRFVAFDIESSDGYFYSGSLCEFGYVVADENFTILEQKNILVRPIKNDFVSMQHIKLSYPIEMYKKADTFVDSYKGIYDLLCAEDVIVVGHAVNNDIVCINSACKINTLPVFSFKFIDTQSLYKQFMDKPNVMSLDKIASEIGEEFLHHRADEDARMSLLTLFYIMKQKKMNINELIEDMQITLGVNDKGKITPFRVQNAVCNAYSLDSKSSKRRIMSMFEPKKNNDLIIDKNGYFYSKKIYFSPTFFLDNINKTRAIIQKLYDLGATVVKNLYEGNILVGDDIDNDLKKSVKISVKDFLEKIGELNIVEYDDEAILKKYNAIKRIKKAQYNDYKKSEKKKES